MEWYETAINGNIYRAFIACLSKYVLFIDRKTILSYSLPNTLQFFRPNTLRSVYHRS